MQPVHWSTPEQVVQLGLQSRQVPVRWSVNWPAGHSETHLPDSAWRKSFGSAHSVQVVALLEQVLHFESHGSHSKFGLAYLPLGQVSRQVLL